LNSQTPTQTFDWRECKVKVLDLSTNILSFLAGGATCGFTDNGDASQVRFGFSDDIQVLSLIRPEP